MVPISTDAMAKELDHIFTDADPKAKDLSSLDKQLYGLFSATPQSDIDSFETYFRKLNLQFEFSI